MAGTQKAFALEGNNLENLDKNRQQMAKMCVVQKSSGVILSFYQENDDTVR